MKASNNLTAISRPVVQKPGFRLSLFMVVSAFVGAQLLISSSARPNEKSLSYASVSGRALSLSNNSGRAPGKFFDADSHRLINASSRLSRVSFALMQSAETINTFQSDCTTAASSFTTGDTVCAHAGGTLVGQRRIYWVNPDDHVVQIDVVSSGTPDATRVVTQLGKWRVYLVDASDGAARAVTAFSVSDPAHLAVDLSVGKGSGDGTFTAGGFARYTVTVTNNGPDAATDVVLTETTPNNTIFVSEIQSSGPIFTCTPGSPTVCTIATLAAGDSASFTFVYTVDANAPVGTVITNQADVTSATTGTGAAQELNPADNTTTIAGTVTGTGGSSPVPCSVACPDDITTPANTTDGSNNSGAIVHFSPPSGNDECGVIVVNHCNDCFFPEGTTTVTATATSGDTCSFTVTVTPSADRPGITCPPNQTANANNNCEATITLGTPTATGNNVTVIGTRSDGKPMYDCDVNGNCTRKSTDLPFGAGITTVTWTAYSHDAPGPYASPGDEESHRTGSASCTQTVTVNDVTPPTINAPPQTVSANANCQAPVPDYSNSASDNCACSSSDTSESCQERERVVVTQSIAAGTLLGPGTYTITLTANDGSSNNNGQGNTTTQDTTFTVRDTTAPTITCPANKNVSNDPGLCSANVNPGTATATDNCDPNPTVSGTRSDNQPLTAPYPVGTTTITWTAIDHTGNPGNLSSCTQTVTVNDTENPTITCPPNITRSNDPGTCSASIAPGTATATDNCSATVSGSRNDGQPLNAAYPVGTTTITWTATDGANNHSSCNQTITVNDTENPTINCPASFTLEPTCPSGAVGNYTTPVGTDNCPGATTARTAGLASGSVFPIGTTTVTYTVNDAHGNSASCSFTVTVKTVSQTIGDLKTSVNGSSLNGTQKQGLVSKLDAALDGLDKGHTNTACTKLADFINSVQTFIDHGDISAAQGQAWITSAAHVRNTIGCTNNPCT